MTNIASVGDERGGEKFAAILSQLAGRVCVCVCVLKITTITTGVSTLMWDAGR